MSCGGAEQDWMWDWATLLSDWMPPHKQGIGPDDHQHPFQPQPSVVLGRRGLITTEFAGPVLAIPVEEANRNACSPSREGAGG